MDSGKDVHVGNVENPSAVVFFLHGLGDTPFGWAQQCQALTKEMPWIKFVLPCAPQNPVTCNGEMKMTSWMDLIDIPILIRTKDNGKQQAASMELLRKLIQAEIDAGVPPERIILGGFSQGAALSLATAVKFDQQLAGCFCLSGWCLPFQKLGEAIGDSANQNIRFFIGHGTQDRVVHTEQAEHTENTLTEGGASKVERKMYPMAHSSHPREMKDLASFIVSCVPKEL